jgi:hypothetical protein
MIVFYKRKGTEERVVGYYNGNIESNDPVLIKMVNIALQCDIKLRAGDHKLPVSGDEAVLVRLKNKIHSPYYLKIGHTDQSFKYVDNVTY